MIEEITVSYERMPCHISDNPEDYESEDDRWAEIDEDAAYEEQRQIEVDAEAFAIGAGNK
jgi:hypothetical protein